MSYDILIDTRNLANDPSSLLWYYVDQPNIFDPDDDDENNNFPY
jgi:hypothetical protein